jgi:hypothetical protein
MSQCELIAALWKIVVSGATTIKYFSATGAKKSGRDTCASPAHQYVRHACIVASKERTYRRNIIPAWEIPSPGSGHALRRLQRHGHVERSDPVARRRRHSDVDLWPMGRRRRKRRMDPAWGFTIRRRPFMIAGRWHAGVVRSAGEAGPKGTYGRQAQSVDFRL